jgi:hypothetical protein
VHRTPGRPILLFFQWFIGRRNCLLIEANGRPKNALAVAGQGDV